MRSRETRKNQGNLEAAVKGNSYGGLAGMGHVPVELIMASAFVFLSGRKHSCVILQLYSPEINYSKHQNLTASAYLSYIGSHDSDSLLGMTRVVSAARMVYMYNVLGRLVPNGLPKGKEERGRPSGPCLVYIYVTVNEKRDHSAQKLNF